MSRPACPFCGEDERVAMISPVGGQIITSQWYCPSCNSYFEAIGETFDAA